MVEGSDAPGDVCVAASRTGHRERVATHEPHEGAAAWETVSDAAGGARIRDGS
jgi:hypothetical protein